MLSFRFSDLKIKNTNLLQPSVYSWFRTVSEHLRSDTQKGKACLSVCADVVGKAWQAAKSTKNAVNRCVSMYSPPGTYIDRQSIVLPSIVHVSVIINEVASLLGHSFYFLHLLNF